MHVNLVDLILRHRFYVVFDGLLYAECERRHVIAVIHLYAYVGDNAVLFKCKPDAVVFRVEQSNTVDFFYRKCNYTVNNARIV